MQMHNGTLKIRFTCFNFLLEKTFQDIQTKFIFQIIDFGFNGTVVKRACPSFFLSSMEGVTYNYLSFFNFQTFHGGL